MYITLLLLVWILYVFTSFSNVHLLEFVLYAVWILYVFTSFSNTNNPSIIVIYVWILYVFTSFSNRSMRCWTSKDVWILYVFTSFSNSVVVQQVTYLFEYYTFLHHSQTALSIHQTMREFEYYTFLHHSQTDDLERAAAIRLNTIRFYIILKPQIQKWSASSALIVWYSNLEK